MLSISNQRFWGQSPETPINLIQRCVKGKSSNYSCAFSRHMGPLLLEDPQLAYKILKKLTRNVPIGAEGTDAVTYKGKEHFKLFKRRIGQELVNRIGIDKPLITEEVLRSCFKFIGALNKLIDLKDTTRKVDVVEIKKNIRPKKYRLIVPRQYHSEQLAKITSFNVEGNGGNFTLNVTSDRIKRFADKIYSDFFQDRKFKKEGLVKWVKGNYFDESEFIKGFQPEGECDVAETTSTSNETGSEKDIFNMIISFTSHSLFHLHNFYPVVILLSRVSKSFNVGSLPKSWGVNPYVLLTPVLFNFILKCCSLYSFYKKEFKSPSKKRNFNALLSFTLIKAVVYGLIWSGWGDGASFFNDNPHWFALSGGIWFVIELFGNYSEVALNTKGDVVNIDKKTGLFLLYTSFVQVLELTQLIISKQEGMVFAARVEDGRGAECLSGDNIEEVRTLHNGLYNLKLACKGSNDTLCRVVLNILENIKEKIADTDEFNDIPQQNTLKATLGILSIENDIEKINFSSKKIADYNIFKGIFKNTENSSIVNTLRQTIGRSVFSDYTTFAAFKSNISVLFTTPAAAAAAAGASQGEAGASQGGVYSWVFVENGSALLANLWSYFSNFSMFNNTTIESVHPGTQAQVVSLLRGICARYSPGARQAAAY